MESKGGLADKGLREGGAGERGAANRRAAAADRSGDQPFVHARVALTVFLALRCAVWANIASHRAELVRASELTLQLSPKEVEEARCA